MKTIATRNLFVNSETVLIGNSRDVTMNLPQNLMRCDEHQTMKISLASFIMRKSFYNINKYNNKFYIVGSDGSNGLSSALVTIPQGNYQSFNDPQNGLAAALETAIDTVLKIAPFTVTNPKTAVTWDLVNNKFTFTFDATGGTNIANMKFVSFTVKNYTQNAGSIVQTIVAEDVLSSFQDTHEIIGGCREERNVLTGTTLEQFNALKALLSVSVNGAVFTMGGFYQASLSSSEAIYVRSDLNSTSFQTAGFDAGADVYPYVVSSQILAKIPLNNPLACYVNGKNPGTPFASTEKYEYQLGYELIEYIDNNDLYSVIVSNKSINTLRLYLTDSYGRPLPEQSKEQLQCNADYFTATIKVEILEDDSKLLTDHIKMMKDMMFTQK